MTYDVDGVRLSTFPFNGCFDSSVHDSGRRGAATWSSASVMEHLMPRLSGVSALQEATRREAEEYDPGDDYDPRDPDAGPPPAPRAQATAPLPVKSVEAPTASREPPPIIKQTQIKTPTVPATSKARAGGRFHTSIYLPRDLKRSVRQIAVNEDCKVYDLLIEAIIDLVATRELVRT